MATPSATPEDARRSQCPAVCRSLCSTSRASEYRTLTVSPSARALIPGAPACATSGKSESIAASQTAPGLPTAWAGNFDDSNCDACLSASRFIVLALISAEFLETSRPKAKMRLHYRLTTVSVRHDELPAAS